MAITVEVKPDFSAFRTPDMIDVRTVVQETVGNRLFNDDAEAIAKAILEHYTILPR